jgi:methyltransferase (TIGR00027 family)
MTIRNISDTARWVAMYRAIESARPDALFNDPYALRLAGERGAAIVETLPQGRQAGWSMVVRTCVFDEIILRLVHGGPGGREPVAAVLNLACGLDTRPYRLALPATLRWIEVDLPEILDSKEAELAAERPACMLERVRLDLADRAARRELLRRVSEGAGTGGTAGTVLVITEGLLVYLRDSEVKELAADLAAQPAMRWWLLDIVSPLILRFLQRSWGKTLDAASAPLRFAPAGGTDFFRPLGWEAAEFRPFLVEAQRLHREMRASWWRRMLGWLTPGLRRDIQRAGTALLEQAAAGPGSANAGAATTGVATAER